MNEILVLEPVLKEKLWGGTKLKTLFNYELTSNHIGESWLISAHKNGRSKITNGKFKGKYLDEVYNSHRSLFDDYKGAEFPLLTKIIDANDVLSVQVHPDDTFAKKYANDLGKTECWYILDAEPGSQIILGHYAQTKDEFIGLIKENAWDKLLKYVDVKPGDFIYVPAGSLHAIGKGIVILETMQSSDTTYRVYDFNRQEKDGSFRELHLKESIEVTTIPHKDLKLEKEIFVYETTSIQRFISNEFFTVEKWSIKNNFNTQNEGFKLFNVIAGEGIINGIKIQKGIGFIATTSCVDLKFEGNLEMVVSYL